MKKLAQSLVILSALVFASCATQSGARNQHQVVKKPKGFTSPNQKIEVEILVESEEGSETSSSFLKGVFKAGAIVPQQVLEESDQYISFVRGEGELTIADQTYFVKDGDSFFIPKGVQHSYVNRSSKDATFFQVYTPQGPEQRFKQWSKLGGL